MNDESTCSCKRTFNKYSENWYFIKPVTVLKEKNFLIELLHAMSNNNGQGFFHHYDEYIGSAISWFICW